MMCERGIEPCSVGVIGKGNMHHEKPCLCASPLMGPTRIYDSELDSGNTYDRTQNHPCNQWKYENDYDTWRQ